MPVSLFWGDEEYNIDVEVKKLRKNIVDPSMAVLSHKVLDEPSLQVLVEAIETTPMMFGSMLIEVHSTKLFLRGNDKISSSDVLMGRLINDLETLQDSLHVLFLCKIPRDTGKKIDSVTKLVKSIKKNGKIEEFSAFKPYETEKISNWVKSYLKREKVNISQASIESLIANTGTDLRKLAFELDKLTLLVHPEKNIEKHHIESLCASYDDIFALTDFYLQGDKTKAILELNKLFDKKHPLQILATLQSMVNKWLVIKLESRSNPPSEISKIVKQHEYVVKLTIEKLKNISVDKLVGLKQNLTDAEFKLKSGNLSANVALETALLS